jgi:ATP-dependent Lon protease
MNKVDLEGLPDDTKDAVEIRLAVWIEEVVDGVLLQKS